MIDSKEVPNYKVLPSEDAISGEFLVQMGFGHEFLGGIRLFLQSIREDGTGIEENVIHCQEEGVEEGLRNKTNLQTVKIHGASNIER